MCVCACVCYMQAMSIWRIHLPSSPIYWYHRWTQSRSTRSGGNLFIHKPKKELGKPQLPHWYYCWLQHPKFWTPEHACITLVHGQRHTYIIISKFHLRNHIECHIDRLSFILPGVFFAPFFATQGTDPECCRTNSSSAARMDKTTICWRKAGCPSTSWTEPQMLPFMDRYEWPAR